MAAGAIHAMEHHRERLAEDHRHARTLGDACRSCDALEIKGEKIDTNMIVCEVDRAWGTADQMAKQLAEQGVRCITMGKQAIRFVTHLDVSADQISRACEIIRNVASATAPKGAG